MNNNTITCPFCAEEISRNDTKCKFCEEDLIELDKTNKSKKNNDIKKYCPTCKEQVHEKAIVCKI